MFLCYSIIIILGFVLNLYGDNRGLKRLERIKVRNVLNILSRLKRLTFLVGEFTRLSCLYVFTVDLTCQTVIKISPPGQCCSSLHFPGPVHVSRLRLRHPSHLHLLPGHPPHPGHHHHPGEEQGYTACPSLR